MRRRMLRSGQMEDGTLDVRQLRAGASEHEPFKDETSTFVIPEELLDYASELRLLQGVPLSYLVPDSGGLLPESLRFFLVDVNWTDALLEGALSIGSVCRREADENRRLARESNTARAYEKTPRIRRMHPNHRKERWKTVAPFCMEEEERSPISGCLMRSELVSRMKGIHVSGFDAGGKELEILRMDIIEEDILLTLFHGRLQEMVLEEPKTGMRFGASAVDESEGGISRSVDLRSALDGEAFGKRLGSLCLDAFTDENGRIHAKRIAGAVEAELKKQGQLGADRMTPSRFAFEMLSVAHRARFVAKTGESMAYKQGGNGDV